MDPGALGGILGFSIMVGCFLSAMLYNNRKKIQKFFYRKKRIPILSKKEAKLHVKNHSKMNTILPPLKTKVIFMKNVNGQRQLIKI